MICMITSSKKRHFEIIRGNLVLAKEKGNTEEINSKLLLAQNKYVETAVHIAAEGSVAVLEKLRGLAKEAQLNEDELKINCY